MTIAALVALAGCAAVYGPSGAPVSAPVDASMGPAQNQEAGYLAASALDGSVVLPPPPLEASLYGKADRAYFDETRSLKDSPRWTQAIQDNDLWGGGALKRFSCAMGVDLGEKQTPTAWKLLHRIEADVRTVGSPAKQHFHRNRPLIGNDKPVCVPREDWMKTNFSYPSGHAMTTWAWALILTEAKPDRGDALLVVGREGGESRLVCGVHFTSDVEAGRTLAAGMVARLHAEPAFISDLAAAKREIAAARGAPTGCGGG